MAVGILFVAPASTYAEWIIKTLRYLVVHKAENFLSPYSSKVPDDSVVFSQHKVITLLVFGKVSKRFILFFQFAFRLAKYRNVLR